MRKNPLLAKREKVRADIFSGSLAVFKNGKSAVPEGGGWRVKISVAAHKTTSIFFKRTPPTKKWGALRSIFYLAVLFS